MTPLILPADHPPRDPDQGAQIIDLARTVAATGDSLAAQFLRAIDIATEFAAHAHAVSNRAVKMEAFEVAAYHLTHSTAAESLAEFLLHRLDLYLDAQILAAAALSTIEH
jgi:hypothetical protein